MEAVLPMLPLCACDAGGMDPSGFMGVMPMFSMNGGFNMNRVPTLPSNNGGWDGATGPGAGGGKGKGKGAGKNKYRIKGDSGSQGGGGTMQLENGWQGIRPLTHPGQARWGVPHLSVSASQPGACGPDRGLLDCCLCLIASCLRVSCEWEGWRA